MENIIIDEEFKALLPALDSETFTGLEENIIEYGVRDPIILWGDTLIDGYNRYAICQKHDLPFRTVKMEFSSREEVLIWIIDNQITRRNLTAYQLDYFRGLHYRANKKIKGSNNQFAQKSENGQNDRFQPTTDKSLAEKYNVSAKTIRRNSKMSETIDTIGVVSPKAKRMVLAGEVSIDKNVLERLASAPQEEIARVATQIEEGSYKKQKVDTGAVMSPLEDAITKISGELFSELKKQAKAGDSGELKITLRLYISMLEDLYQEL